MSGWKRPGRFFWGWIAGLATVGVIAGAIGALTLLGYTYDISANTPHAKIVAWAVHTTMTNTVKHNTDEGAFRAQPGVPARVIAGARVYEQHCLACHGGPGVARAPWASAMLPTPPFLLEASTKWTPSELGKIIRDGVKMTSMPAWGEIIPEEEIGDTVSFLVALPKMRPEQYARLREAVRAEPATALGASGPAMTMAPSSLAETRPFSQTVRPRPSPNR